MEFLPELFEEKNLNRWLVIYTGCVKKVDNFETALNLAKRLEV